MVLYAVNLLRVSYVDVHWWGHGANSETVSYSNQHDRSPRLQSVGQTRPNNRLRSPLPGKMSNDYDKRLDLP